MEIVSMMMITIPIFLPILYAVHLDPIWFSVIYLINCSVAMISPPFGMSLFVMKSVAPKDTTMGDVYRAALPFCGVTIFAMAVIIAFPQIALWLPNTLMK